MNDLVNAWTKVGAAGFLVLLTAYALLWHVIPYCKAKGVKEQEFKHKQSDRIQEREDGILRDVAGLIRQNIAESQRMTERMDVLTEEIRQEHRTRRRQ